jgi:arginyl-tRNA synthetase
MNYTYDRLRTEATAILKATGLVPEDAISLVTPKANIPADVAFPVFAAAKATNAGNPAQFAQRIVEAARIPEGALISKVEAQGGFVNFATAPEAFAQAVVSEVLVAGDTYGSDPSVGAGKKVVVEYSSPNIAKKLHVGSLRTTVIGHSIYLIMKALGYDVIGDNHLGDWGTQFGYILAAIHDNNLTPWNDPDPVASLMDVYSAYSKASKENPAIRDSAREWFKKLEDGDTWARETWQKIIALSLAEFEKTYKRLNITFDTQIGESFFEPVLNDLVQEAVDKGVATVEPGGAVAVDFGEDSKLPSCLLRKTDGATLYQTRDAATLIYRWREYQPDRNIYVVGSEQKLHFQQVFEIARRMGYPEIADRSVHIPFGMVKSATGERFKTRTGNLILADEILDEAIMRMTANIQEKIDEGKTELTPDQLEYAAEMMGVGAVIYADLYQGPDRDIKFDWDAMLSPVGNTATYIQYTHARCRSILRKAGETGEGADLSLLTAPEETVVLKQLVQMPQAVREAGEKFLPATIAEWTYTLGREYARFYDACPVLTAETPELRKARLALTEAVAQGLKNGLALLGIGAPDRI